MNQSYVTRCARCDAASIIRLALNIYPLDCRVLHNAPDRSDQGPVK